MIEIHITGDRGSGKTTLAVEIARYLRKETACQVRLVGEDEKMSRWLEYLAEKSPKPELSHPVPVEIHDHEPLVKIDDMTVRPIIERPQRRSIHKRYIIEAHSQAEAFEELQIRVQNSMSLNEAEELGIDPNNWQFKCFEQSKSQLAYLIDGFMGWPSAWVFYVTFKRLESEPCQ